jgi:hypothetical protein
MAPVNNELVDLLKTLLVQEVIDSFSGRHFSLGVLVIDLILAAADLCFEVPLLKVLDFVFNIHQEPSCPASQFSSLGLRVNAFREITI